jgi:hypothetical protein
MGIDLGQSGHVLALSYTPADSLCHDLFNTRYCSSCYSIMNVRTKVLKQIWMVHKPNAFTAGAHVIGKVTWGSPFRSLISDFNTLWTGIFSSIFFTNH